MSCFIAEKGSDGLTFGKPEEKLGQHAAITTSLTFEDCFVPDAQLLGEQGKGFSYAMASLDAGRIGYCGAGSGELRGRPSRLLVTTPPSARRLVRKSAGIRA